jgi:hypothetical protein
MTKLKFKWHALTGVAMLAVGVVAGHAMSVSAVRELAPRAAASVATYDMMIAARNLPAQVVETLY